MLKQDRIELEHRQAAGNLDLHGVPRQNFPRALQHAADNLANVVTCHVGLDRAGLELGHVEQIGNEAVELSDSSRMVAKRSILALSSS